MRLAPFLGEAGGQNLAGACPNQILPVLEQANPGNLPETVKVIVYLQDAMRVDLEAPMGKSLTMEDAEGNPAGSVGEVAAETASLEAVFRARNEAAVARRRGGGEDAEVAR